MFPIVLEGVTALAFADTGATFSVVSGQIAKIIKGYHKRPSRPSGMTAEVFGPERRIVCFQEQMELRIGLSANQHMCNFQILEGMQFDVLIGDDVLKVLKLNISYELRSVSSFGTVLKFAARGDVIFYRVMADDLEELVDRWVQAQSVVQAK